jgi:starch phosphorylase
MNLYERLEALAHNLRWDWHGPTRALFRDLDPELWDQVGHNPVALLRRVDPTRLEDRDGLEERVSRLYDDLQAYLDPTETWFGEAADPSRPLVAYFSAEFGITEALRIYSGGLGVLAGDHLKSASDLGVPLVAVGMLYREGYFKQSVDSAGSQTESFPVADFDDLPVRPVSREDGFRLIVSIPCPSRRVMARVWRADVGRIPLYLLDTDVPENHPRDRAVTARLYGGGQEMRLTQEIVLGMGGYRALVEMGIRPRAYHMNEGHSAFLGLELVRDLMQSEGIGFDEAAAVARARTVFTTHTPVPAGHDRFGRDLVARYFTGTAHGLGLGLEAFMDLGRVHAGSEEPFTMTALAIRLAERINGVSALHGRVSREMWTELWPDRSVDDVPIGHITNGVHLPSWVHPEVGAIYGTAPGDLGLDGRAPDPEPARLWQVRGARRAALVDYVRGATGAELDPGTLTIAFARRFATYKRATLIFSDLDRLSALVNDPERPVQLLFAGKAHPKDEPGKAFIRRIGEVSRMEEFRNRVVFLADYGIDVARQLVQGADVWLNNPRRPMEASGTSGMKAAANGVVNVSILDGWWDEAWRHRDPDAAPPGWAIGGTEEEDRDAADRADAEALIRVLEEEVVPTFYDRDAEGLPRDWLERARQSIRQVAPVFTTHRMLTEYVTRYREAASAAGASAG